METRLKKTLYKKLTYPSYQLQTAHEIYQQTSCTQIKTNPESF